MPKPAFECVGFTPKETGISPNCSNCKNWNGKCLVRGMLDDLYAESSRGLTFDRMMRSNRGVRIE
ncbi:hypothetical protein DOT_5639 [Desulfosporosinus sp. OT]|nr:hypothetical protein DOT_5639 [Desulfosporosinus sp. OT]